MFHPASAFIGLRYARSGRTNHFISFINLFSVIGIALGLTSLITVSSVMNGFQGQLKQRILGITPHIVADTRERPDVAEALTNINGVQRVTPLIEAEGVVQSLRGLQGVLIQGVMPEDMVGWSIVADNMLDGKLSSLQAGEYSVVIGRALAIKLNIRVGDKIRVMSAGASVYSPFGRLYSQRVFRVAGLYDVGSELDDKVIFMHIDDAARLLRSKRDALAQTRLFLREPFAYQQVSDDITRQFDLPMNTWRARQGPLFDAVKMEKNMMALMLVLIIAVAAFNIVSALVMVVTEKQGDIAILRTQGMTDKEVTRIFVINGLYNGAKGTVFGLMGGLVLVYALNPVLDMLGVTIMLGDGGQHLPIDVQWSQVALLVLLSLALTFIATLYPAYKALKVEPASALKYE